LEHVRQMSGDVLRPDQVYLDDTDQYWGHINRFDKLERLQYFREPGYPSWDSFAAGHWGEALQIMRQDRLAVEKEFAEDSRLGLNSYRVRVVELPVTPYLQWELHELKARAECGEGIRVVEPEAVARYETSTVVPELIFMGTLAMYEICYDDTGTRLGGRKFTDPELIEQCLSEVHALYDHGEDLLMFFEREIAPLPPPIIDPEFTSSSGS
ncbi:MAG: DUF6879 family protein, partial [Pseudonocardiaceae bacterium]